MIIHCDSLTHSNGGCRNVVCCCKISGGPRLTGQLTVIMLPKPPPQATIFGSWFQTPQHIQEHIFLILFCHMSKLLVRVTDRQLLFRLWFFTARHFGEVNVDYVTAEVKTGLKGHKFVKLLWNWKSYLEVQSTPFLPPPPPIESHQYSPRMLLWLS